MYRTHSNFKLHISVKETTRMADKENQDRFLYTELSHWTQASCSLQKYFKSQYLLSVTLSLSTKIE